MLCEKSPKIALRVSETLELSGGLQRPRTPSCFFVCGGKFPFKNFPPFFGKAKTIPEQGLTLRV